MMETIPISGVYCPEVERQYATYLWLNVRLNPFSGGLEWGLETVGLQSPIHNSYKY